MGLEQTSGLTIIVSSVLQLSVNLCYPEDKKALWREPVGNQQLGGVSRQLLALRAGSVSRLEVQLPEAETKAAVSHTFH